MPSYYRSGKWFSIEIDLDFRKLRGIVRCRLRGHAEPDEAGLCPRCRADLLHLPNWQKLAVLTKQMNRHLSQHMEYLVRERRGLRDP